MYYCMYVSSARHPLPDQELMNIKAQSKAACEKSGITGLLVFHRNTFIHYYEGEKRAVGKMLSFVSKDKRHKDVKVIDEGKLDQRQFPNWSMELRVLDKDPLFTAGERVFSSRAIENEKGGVKKLINDYFMSI